MADRNGFGKDVHVGEYVPWVGRFCSKDINKETLNQN